MARGSVYTDEQRAEWRAWYDEDKRRTAQQTADHFGVPVTQVRRYFTRVKHAGEAAVGFTSSFPYKRTFASSNTRCELAEGVAFDKKLENLTDEQKLTINAVIHEYLEWILGPATIKD